MPKANKRRKKTAEIGMMRQRASQSAAQVSTASTAPARGVSAGRRAVSPGTGGIGGLQTLVFPAMVALGCWGMAFTLAYFYNDPNRFLFAGMAVLMGLFWTYSLYIRYTRIRKARNVQ